MNRIIFHVQFLGDPILLQDPREKLYQEAIHHKPVYCLIIVSAQAITKLSTLVWTDACAFSERNTREWIWYYSGEVIGIMHEPQGGSEGDQFYYTPNSDNVRLIYLL